MKQKNQSILYIITKLELGGAQKVCLHLATELKKKGFKPTILSGSHGILTEKAHNSCDTFFLKSFSRECSLFTFYHDALAFIELVRTIRSFKKKDPYLIVHTHSTKAGILGRWAAFIARAQYRVHTIHGFAFHQHQLFYKRWFILSAEFITAFITTHFICVSSEDTRIGISYLPAFTRKHSIIRAGVDQKQFKPAHKILIDTFDTVPNPLFVFGTISCFKPQKNILDLLQSFAYVYTKSPRCRLEIIGDGIERPIIEKEIVRLNIEKSVILHGWQDTVHTTMRTWHAFILSSLWEGLPCAIIEARLLNLPVLAYNTGGIKDIIIHGKNGFLYEQKNWYLLAQGMNTIMHDQTLYRTLSSHEDDLSSFDHEIMVQEHMHLYKNLMKRRAA